MMTQTEENKIIYNVYDDVDQSSNDATVFDNIDDAISYARANNSLEVEEMWWDSYEDYNDGKFADGYHVIWRR